MTDAEHDDLVRRTAEEYGVGLEAAAQIAAAGLGRPDGDFVLCDEDGSPAPPTDEPEPLD